MKLLVKLPKEKPPFIGILLADTDNRAYPERLNEDLINEHKYADYRLVFSFAGGRLTLSLIAGKSSIERHYPNLEFDGAQLAAWIYQTRRSKQFNFGHVRLERGKETIIKTWGKKINFVLAVQAYEVVTA